MDVITRLFLVSLSRKEIPLRNFYVRSFLIIVGLAVLLSISALPVGAHIFAHANAPSGPRILCGHLVVHLNGHNPATTKCSDKKDSHGRVIPNLYVSDCSAKTLIIYADSNQSGWTICFYGSGWTNMTEYCGPAPEGCFWNWNDNASSFRTGCSYANNFFADTNGEGTEQSAGSYQSGNFNGHPLYNDSLSSVYVGGEPC